MSGYLAVFDFDHTIIDCNSDTVVRDLIPSQEIPDHIKEQYNRAGWTAYMQAIFKLLRERNVTEDIIKITIQNIPPLSGMDNLLFVLKNDYQFDTIIISDSNSYFIDTWLESHNLKDYVNRVFTNPAYFDNQGLLNIKMYHLQTKCRLSTKNLCKGRILDEYLAAQERKGITYRKVFYTGDGYNDVCPILRLKEEDVALVRENYRCASLIKSVHQDGPSDASNELYSIKCNLFYWQNGEHILNGIKEYL